MATSSKKPLLRTLPLLNSIPPELAARFEPTYLEYYNKYSAGRLATHQVPIEDYRRDPAKYTTLYGRQLIDKANLKVIDLKCPVDGGEITVRFVEPPAGQNDAPRPAYINFHGGGWVFGGLFVDYDFCKRIAHEVGCVVIDVDYRLSPEFKYPIPVDDCWAAFNWIRDQQASAFNLDLSRIAIGGCSAGGHLAAVVAHMCRDAAIPLAFQLLEVPVCDLSIFTPDGKLQSDQPYASYRELEFTQPLPLERMAYFHKHFLGNPRPEGLADDWKVSPMKAKNFEGLAPALVIVAEMDVLRDEGKEYARKMNNAGSKAKLVMIKGAPHTVMQMDDILEGGKEFNRVVIQGLRDALLE